jgi:putative Mg2+ transporter-C (MgtC) family protein
MSQAFADFAHPFPFLAWQTVLVRLLLATALGGVIGLERESHGKPAGLRTHMLIALAACLFALLADGLMMQIDGAGDHMRADPLRLIEAVTAGVAFLAAGSIIRDENKVKGLTTGAGMWMAGAIGLACGVGQAALAILGTTVALIVLFVLRRLEH